jgi:hypothetical protein
LHSTTTFFGARFKSNENFVWQALPLKNFSERKVLNRQSIIHSQSSNGKDSSTLPTHNGEVISQLKFKVSLSQEREAFVLMQKEKFRVRGKVWEVFDGKVLRGFKGALSMRKMTERMNRY